MTSSYFIFGLVATNHRASFYSEFDLKWVTCEYGDIDEYLKWLYHISRVFYVSSCMLQMSSAMLTKLGENNFWNRRHGDVEKRVFFLSKLLGRDSMDRGGIVRVTNKKYAQRCALSSVQLLCTVLFLSLLNIFISCASLNLFTHCQITEDCLAWNFLLNQHQDIIILWALNWHSLWEKK